MCANFSLPRCHAEVEPHLYHILFGLLDGILNVQVSLGVSDGVTNTDGVTWRASETV